MKSTFFWLSLRELNLVISNTQPSYYPPGSKGETPNPFWVRGPFGNLMKAIEFLF